MRKLSKRTIVVGSAILLLVAVIIATVAVLGALKPKEQDPYKQTETSASESSNEAVEPDDATSESSTPDQSSGATSNEATALDSATVGTIDIQAVGLTVSYVKGISAFEYVILRADNGTQYIELRSADLVGTKCTDDTGVFASIIIAPKDYETSALTKTTTVDGTKYGLSLSGDNCTSDITKLQSYQKSFSDAFSLLKKTN